jgi:hypothetical protein
MTDQMGQELLNPGNDPISKTLMDLTSTSISKNPKTKIKIPKELGVADAPKGLARLVTSQEYKNLSDDGKKLVRGKAYDKYLVPYYKLRGVSGPSKGEFVNSKYKPLEDVNQHTVGVGLASISKGALKTVGDFADLTHRLHNTLLPGKDDPGYDATKAYLAKLSKRDTDYLTDNYEDTFKNSVVTGLGELVGQEGVKSPVYAGVGKGLQLGEGLLKGIPVAEELATSARPAVKFAYHTLKSAADGYLSTVLTGGSQKEAGETAIAGGGLHVAGSIVSGAFTKFLAKVVGAGGTKVAVQSMEAAASPAGEKTVAKGYQATKLTEQLTKANAEFLNAEAKKRGATSYWMSKSEVKKEILDKWSEHVKSGVEQSVAANPQVVHAKVAADLDKAVAVNPTLKKNLESFEKISGMPASKLISDKVVDDAKRKTPGALKSIQRQLDKNVLKALSGLGPGATSVSEEGLWKKVSKTLKNSFKLEGHTSQVLFAYANRDTLPEKYLPVVRQQMKNLYGDNPKKWALVEKNFNAHTNKLLATGHVAPDDMRGIFRSTKFEGRKTYWQKQLHEEYVTGKQFDPTDEDDY